MFAWLHFFLQSMCQMLKVSISAGELKPRSFLLSLPNFFPVSKSLAFQLSMILCSSILLWKSLEQCLAQNRNLLNKLMCPLNGKKLNSSFRWIYTETLPPDFQQKLSFFVPLEIFGKEVEQTYCVRYCLFHEEAA